MLPLSMRRINGFTLDVPFSTVLNFYNRVNGIGYRLDPHLISSHKLSSNLTYSIKFIIIN